MTSLKRLSVLLLAFLLALSPSLALQNEAARALMRQMPVELRERAQGVLDGDSDAERAGHALFLARQAPAPSVDYLLAVLQEEQSIRVRRVIIHHLGRHQDPRIKEALRNLVLSEKNIDLAVLASQRLAATSYREAQKLIDERIASGSAGAEQAQTLAAEQERLMCLASGVILPDFLRTPPEVFSVPGNDPTVRVLAIGDFGDGGETQARVGEAMRQRHERHPFDFAITVGDNFQDYGPDSPVESRWKTYWEHLYPKLGIPFYATLGNHDWQAESGPAAEVLRTQIDPSWKMPASHYTFVSGPVQFFALNTNLISDRQLHWLAKSLRESQATWKIAYAHHPIFSSGSHGDTGELVKRLLPLIDGKVDAYFSGHDHHMEHLVSPLNQTQFFVCGTGGHSLRQPKPGTKTKFVACIYGWAEIEATSKQLTVRFVDEEKKALYEYRFAPLK